MLSDAIDGGLGGERWTVDDVDVDDDEGVGETALVSGVGEGRYARVDGFDGESEEDVDDEGGFFFRGVVAVSESDKIWDSSIFLLFPTKSPSPLCSSLTIAGFLQPPEGKTRWFRSDEGG